MIVTGGYEMGYVNKCIEYDSKTNSVKNIEKMSVARYGHSMLFFEGFVYVFGGYNKNDGDLRSCERFDM